MVVQLQEFFGGGTSIADLSADTQLGTGCGRVIVVDNISNASASLQLPFKAVPKIFRLGWPVFLIVNRDATDVLKVANFNDLTTRYSVAADRCVYVGLDDENNWSFTEAKVFESDH